MYDCYSNKPKVCDSITMSGTISLVNLIQVGKTGRTMIIRFPPCIQSGEALHGIEHSGEAAGKN